MKKEKESKSIVKSVLDKASYSVGFLCAKTAKIKDITNAKAWKKTVSASKGLMEKASETTSAFVHDAKEGASHIKESFINGFESAKDELAKHSHAKKAYAPAVEKEKDENAPAKETKAKARPKSKARSGKKAASKTKTKKAEEAKEAEEVSEVSKDADIEKELNKIDEEVAEVS